MFRNKKNQFLFFFAQQQKKREDTLSKTLKYTNNKTMHLKLQDHS